MSDRISARPPQRWCSRAAQVLCGLTFAASDTEIARDLAAPEPIVKLHMKTLCRKIGASNRTQAALLANQAGRF